MGLWGFAANVSPHILNIDAGELIGADRRRLLQLPVKHQV